MEDTLIEVNQTLLQLSSFVKNNPNVVTGHTAKQLSDLADRTFQIIRDNAKK